MEKSRAHYRAAVAAALIVSIVLATVVAVGRYFAQPAESRMLELSYPLYAFLLVIIPSLAYLFLARTPSPKCLARLMGGLHGAAVALFALSIFANITAGNHAAVMEWAPFYYIDLPVSLIMLPALDLREVIVVPEGIAAYLFPLVVFGLAGSVQYYLLGRLVYALYERCVRSAAARC